MIKKIHLLENKFYSLIVEAMDVNDIHTKYYSDIPYNDYLYIVKVCDPTYDSALGKMGKYAKWLLGMYRRGSFKRGDFDEARRLLPIYEKYKNRVQVRDVTQLHSMGELYQVVKPFMEGNQATSKSDAIRMAKQGAEKVYEDDQWLVIIPRTMEAAQIYGEHTKWCTAAEDPDDNMFDYYNRDGWLYINIDKANNRKYQFHFESGSFMDEEDDEIEKPILDSIGATNGLKEFYKKKIGVLEYIKLSSNFDIDDGCEYLWKEYKKLLANGGNENEAYLPEAYLVWNEDRDKCCFVNSNAEIISDWFDDANSFGFYRPARDPWRIGPTTYVTVYADRESSIYRKDLRLDGNAIFNGQYVYVNEWKDESENERYPDLIDDGEYGTWYVNDIAEEDEDY